MDAKNSKLMSTKICFNTASGKHCCNFHWRNNLQELLVQCFNTASGKHCCNLPHQLFRRRGTIVRFNTASGKHCCNDEGHDQSTIVRPVSIPQAVSTVATYLWIRLFKERSRVSIPQAVSTVATLFISTTFFICVASFNTASGKHCCNSGV